MKYVLYADDIQIYVKCKASEMNNVVLTMESCLHEVNQWITSVGLILNPTKTEFIILLVKATFMLLWMFEYLWMGYVSCLNLMFGIWE